MAEKNVSYKFLPVRLYYSLFEIRFAVGARVLQRSNSSPPELSEIFDTIND